MRSCDLKGKEAEYKTRVGIWNKTKKREKNISQFNSAGNCSLRTAQEHGSTSLACNQLSVSFGCSSKRCWSWGHAEGSGFKVVYCMWPDDPNGPYSQNDSSLIWKIFSWNHFDRKPGQKRKQGKKLHEKVLAIRDKLKYSPLQWSLTETNFSVSEMCSMYMYKCVSVLRYFFLNILDIDYRCDKNVLKLWNSILKKCQTLRLTTESHNDALNLGKRSIISWNKTWKLHSVPVKWLQSCLCNRGEHPW